MIKQLCNHKLRDFAMAFEKLAPGLLGFPTFPVYSPWVHRVFSRSLNRVFLCSLDFLGTKKGTRGNKNSRILENDN